MSFNLRLPNITGVTEREQLAQIKSYLYQQAQQLQWALNELNSVSSSGVVAQKQQSAGKETAEINGQYTFNAIKALIIKSADIINAYYDVISQRLDGEYVAKSDFGTFKEKTSQDIIKTSSSIESIYDNIQEIVETVGGIKSTLISVKAHIKSGLLYTGEDGVPVYGLEIGQINTVDDTEVFNKYARFTSDRLSFYDANDTEVAYISDNKLYITNAEFTGVIILGAFKLNTTKGIQLKYVGRG